MAAIKLQVRGLPGDTLRPFEVRGDEALSQLYVFDVSCILSKAVGLPAGLLGADAELTLSLDGAAPRLVKGVVDRVWHGSPTLHQEPVVRIRIVPALSALDVGRTSRILGAQTPVSVRNLLTDGLAGNLPGSGLAPGKTRRGVHHELRLMSDYQARDHVVQYMESDLAFLSRHAEHWGIFFFFETEAAADELVVFADHNQACTPLPDDAQLRWYPWSPGRAEAQPDTIHGIDVELSPLPGRVIVRDYNYRYPHVPLLSEAVCDPNGTGEWVDYGGHFRTPQEGDRLAQIRAEMLACQGERFRCRSTVPRLAPGRRFQLTRHPYTAWNQEYLVLSVRHEVRIPLPGVDAAGLSTGYFNEFTAIPVRVPFRPERKTPWPRIEGILNGRIDGDDPTHPVIDDQGRYRVRLPFDFGDAPDGQASAWTRLATPFGGDGDGMHFPLYPGTEVIISCINGNPDRPIILGAVPNPRTPSVITQANRLSNKLMSRHGMGLLMEAGNLAPASDEPTTGTELRAQYAFDQGAQLPVGRADGNASALSPQGQLASVVDTSNDTKSSLRLYAGASAGAMTHYLRIGDPPTTDPEDLVVKDPGQLGYASVGQVDTSRAYGGPAQRGTLDAFNGKAGIYQTTTGVSVLRAGGPVVATSGSNISLMAGFGTEQNAPKTTNGGRIDLTAYKRPVLIASYNETLASPGTTAAEESGPGIRLSSHGPVRQDSGDNIDIRAVGNIAAVSKKSISLDAGEDIALTSGSGKSITLNSTNISQYAKKTTTVASSVTSKVTGPTLAITSGYATALFFGAQNNFFFGASFSFRASADVSIISPFRATILLPAIVGVAGLAVASIAIAADGSSETTMTDDSGNDGGVAGAAGWGLYGGLIGSTMGAGGLFPGLDFKLVLGIDLKLSQTDINLSPVALKAADLKSDVSAIRAKMQGIGATLAQLSGSSNLIKAYF